MSLISILNLEPRSESLAYRSCFDSVGSESLLEWWVNRFSTTPTCGRLYIVCHGEIEQARLANLLRDSDVTVFRSEYLGQLRCLTEVVKASGALKIALLPFGFALSPKGLLGKVYAHHKTQKNSYTLVRRIAKGAAPAIFESDLILSLDGFPLPRLPSDPVLLVERLRSLVETTGQPLPFRLNSVPFDASLEYKCDPTVLPRSVRIETPGDVEIFRRVCVRRKPETEKDSDCSALEFWKEEMTRDVVRRREQRVVVGALGTGKLPSTDINRVLFVSNPSAFSGAEQSLCQLVGQIDGRRFEKVCLIAMDGLFAERLREAGTTVICRHEDFGRYTVDNFHYSLSILRRIRPSIIHMNGLSGLPVIYAATILGIPIVQHVRTALIESYNEYLKSADAIIAISEFVKEELLRFNVPKERVHLIYDAVDPEHFRKSLFDAHEIRRQFGIPPNAKIALMIARFHPSKRHDVLLKAAAKVRTKVPSFHLILVGEALEPDSFNHFDVMHEQAKNLGLRKSTTWLRFVPDIRLLQAAADVLVLCSDREGLGQCVVESMAMELPVIVPNSGGPREIVRDRECGFVVESGNIDALAQAMIEALTNKDECTRHARAGRKYVESNLDANTAAKQVMAIYDSLSAEL